MRILDVDAARAGEAARLTGHLVEGERVFAAFVSPHGSVLCTDRRILLLQQEHLLEARVETSSWPWREVRRFSIQEGLGSRTAIRIWLGDEAQPLHLRANEGTDLAGLQRLLADRVA
jgi:hypothetical protein